MQEIDERLRRHGEWLDATFGEPTERDAAPYAWAGALLFAAIFASGAATAWAAWTLTGWLL